MSQVERTGGYGQIVLPNGDDEVSAESSVVRSDPSLRGLGRPLREDVPIDRAGRNSSGWSTDGAPALECAAGSLASGNGAYPDKAQALLDQDAWEGVPRGQRLLTERGSATVGLGPIDAARLDALAAEVLAGVCG